MGAFSDFLGGLVGGVTGIPTTEVAAAGGIGGLFAPVTAFFATVTDGRMWRSLGWLILGLIITGIGINLWLHNPVGKAIGGAAKAGEAAAVL